MNYQLEDIINKEKLLDYAIKRLIEDKDDEICHNILSWYILNELPLDHTEEEYIEKYTTYLARGVLRSLSNKEILEFNFDKQEYELTELGIEVQKKNVKGKK